MSIGDSTPILRTESNHEQENLSTIQSIFNVEGSPDEMRSSPVRRTFCIIVLFDFLLCFLFWVLSVKFIDKTTTIEDKFKHEIKHFTFNESLFDCACINAANFLFLEIIYGCLQSSQIWCISVSTTLITIFVIIKIAYQSVSSGLFNYILLISTILSAWIATFFFMHRVLTKEKAAVKAREYERYIQQQQASSICSSENIHGASGSLIQYHMGIGSRISTNNPSRLSPAMSSCGDNDEFFSPSQSRPPSPTQIRIRNLIHIGNDLRESAWQVVTDKTGWDYCAGDAVKGFITSKIHPCFKGKMFKIECLLNVTAELLYKDMLHNVENTHQWNPQIKEVQKIENVSENVDIIYNVTNDALRGYVSPRDFVLLRVWGRVDHSFVICNQSYDHPKYPPKPNLVRGEYILGVIKLSADKRDPEQTKCVWIINTDLKGRLIKSLIDRNMPSVLLDLIDNLRQHCYSINSVN